MTNTHNAKYIPEHVPVHLVRYLDIFNMQRPEEDPFYTWKRIQRDYPPLFWTPYNNGHWVLTRARDILAVQEEAVLFSTRGMLIPNIPRPYPAPPLDFDPPEHAAWRMLLSPAFSPKVVKEIEDELRAIVRGIVAEIKPRGECEFVRDVAGNLPVVAFLRMMDLPLEDGEQLAAPVDVIVSTNDPDKLTEARLKLKSYVEAVVAERQLQPRDDLISKLLASKVGGHQVPQDHVVGMVALALNGGLDTTKNLLSHCCRFLAMHPGHVWQLRERPELVPIAVEELVRRHAIANTGRLVTSDCEVRGVLLKAGDQIVGVNTLANLDDETVPDPMGVDFGRQTPIPVATFGNGPHRCPGNILARRELRVWLEEWLAAIPEFELNPDRPPEMTIGANNRVVSLPLRWPV